MNIIIMRSQQMAQVVFRLLLLSPNGFLNSIYQNYPFVWKFISWEFDDELQTGEPWPRQMVGERTTRQLGW